jgi:hypothetical protein
MDEETRRKSPQEKKRLETSRDFVSPSEYPHAFRKGWPRKEARAERARRRASRQEMRGLLSEEEQEATREGPAREPVRKWGARPLGEDIGDKIARRVRRAVWGMLQSPRARQELDARCEELLLGVVRREDAYCGPLAQFWEELLTQRPPWLARFLAQSPAWEGRLRDWIDRVGRRS